MNADLWFLPLPVGGAPGLRSQERVTAVGFGEERCGRVWREFPVSCASIIMPTPVHVQKTPKTNVCPYASAHTGGPTSMTESLSDLAILW